MFKGVYSVFTPKRPRSVNSRDSSESPKRAYSNLALSEDSPGNSSFFADDVQEQGLYPQATDLTPVDSSEERVGELFVSNISKGESSYRTGEEVFITPTFLIPQNRPDSTLSLDQDLYEESTVDPVEEMEQEESFPASAIPTRPKSGVDSWPLFLNSTAQPQDRRRTMYEEDSPGRRVPTKSATPIFDTLWPPPSRAPTKPTSPSKSLFDDLSSFPATGKAPHVSTEMKASQKLASPTNLTFTQSDSTAAPSAVERNAEGSSMNPSSPKSDPQETTAPKMHFKGFINGVATWRIESTQPSSTGNDSSPRIENNPFPQEKTVKKMSSTSSFLRKVAALSSKSETSPVKDVPSDQKLAGPHKQESGYHSPPPVQEHEETESRRPRRRQHNPFAMLQPIVESSTFTPEPAASPTPFGSSLYGVDSSFARKMEEAGRLRRLQSQSQIDLKSGNTSPTPATKSEKHARSSSERTERTPSSSSSAPNTPLQDLSSNIVVPPDPPPKTPSKISPTASRNEHDSPRTPNSHAAELQALRDQLTHTMREKHVYEKELARVAAQSSSDRDRLMRELRTLKQDHSVILGRHDLLAQRTEDMRSQLARAQTELRKLTEEKRGWQEQLDTMHHKVVRAERQIRCLDHLTRAKLEAREEAVYGLTKRTKLALTQKRSGEEVISAISDLNEEILQAANLLIENLERTRFYGSITESCNKAEKVVGTHVTEMLKAQAGSSASGFRQLLMLVVMEVFLVHWCSAIIEGFYPKRPSFADLLVELSSHTTTTTALGCGKQLKVVETQSSATIAVQFPTWASEIIRDLADILLVGGLKMKSKRQDVFKNKIQTIIALAYDLRAALAEKDICGGVELVVVSPDSPFQPKWMQEGHTTERRGTTTMLTQMEAIAGTTGLGLKRPNVGGMESDAFTYPLKPKVVLARVLRESLA